MNFDIASAVLWAFPLLLAVVLHEWAHGYTAYRFGDRTAASLGRLSLNPIVHVDPIGTIAMPLFLLVAGSPFLFGYAKPVPIGWQNLRNPARDMVYVAAAGPAMNIALAIVSAILFGILTRTASPESLSYGAAADPAGFAVVGPLAVMAWRSVLINVVLAVFNLLPIPPLDGGRVAVGLLPHGAAVNLARLEPFGFIIVFGLLMTGVLGVVMGPVIHLVLGALSIFM
jgi:Zn-dependent protease